MLNDLNLTGLKRVVTILILSAFILSCSDVQEIEEPDNLISEDKMIDIYTDMILLDAVERSSPKNFKAYELESSEHIVNKYKIDSVTLSENIKYYNLNFEKNTRIYEKVKENIAQKEEKIDSITTLRDSLKNIRAKLKDSIQKNKNTQTKN